MHAWIVQQQQHACVVLKACLAATFGCITVCMQPNSIHAIMTEHGLVRRGVVESTLSLVRPVPLIGALAEKAGEILFGIQQYYTYTSAS